MLSNYGLSLPLINVHWYLEGFVKIYSRFLQLLSRISECPSVLLSDFFNISALWSSLPFPAYPFLLLMPFLSSHFLFPVALSASVSFIYFNFPFLSFHLSPPSTILFLDVFYCSFSVLLFRFLSLSYQKVFMRIIKRMRNECKKLKSCKLNL